VKLDKMEKNAFATVFEMQRELSDRFRGNAAAYIRAAYEYRDRTDIEAKKRGDKIWRKKKLDPQFMRDFVGSRIALRDPVFGPFRMLIETKENREQVLSQMLEGKTKGVKYNPIVLDYLRKAGTLPNELGLVAALFEKMCREKVEPVAGAKPNPKADPVLELERWNPQRDCESCDRLQQGRQRSDEFGGLPGEAVGDGGRHQHNPEGTGTGESLCEQRVRTDNRARLNQINELKLTAKGGPVRAMVIEDLPKPVDSPIFPRGNMPKPGEDVKVVPRRFIEVLAQGDAQPFKEGSGRYELAQAIAQ